MQTHYMVEEKSILLAVVDVKGKVQTIGCVTNRFYAFQITALKERSPVTLIIT